MSQGDCSNGNGVAFFAGVGLTTLVAVVHNADKNEHHQAELAQTYRKGYWKRDAEMQEILLANNLEIGNLRTLLRQRDIELGKKDIQIASLAASVQTLSNTLKAQELQRCAKVFPQDGEENALN